MDQSSVDSSSMIHFNGSIFDGLIFNGFIFNGLIFGLNIQRDLSSVDFTFNSFIFNGFILYNRWPDATLEPTTSSMITARQTTLDRI
jgi:hypothetical protein